MNRNNSPPLPTESYQPTVGYQQPTVEYFSGPNKRTYLKSESNPVKSSVEYYTPPPSQTRVTMLGRASDNSSCRRSTDLYASQANNDRNIAINNRPGSVQVKPYQSSAVLGYNKERGLSRETVTLTSGEPLPFCNDGIGIETDFFQGLNQSLAWNNSQPLGFNQASASGRARPMNKAVNAHPLTKIAPVIAPPSHDLEAWKDNNLIVHSAINSEGIQQEMYMSGYAESSCCGYIGAGAELVPESSGLRPGEAGLRPTLVGGRTLGSYPDEVNRTQYAREMTESNDHRGNMRENYSDPKGWSVPFSGPYTTQPASTSCGNRSTIPQGKYTPIGSVISPSPVTDVPWIPTKRVPSPMSQLPQNREDYCGTQSTNAWHGNTRELGAVISPTPVGDTPWIPTSSVPSPIPVSSTMAGYLYGPSQSSQCTPIDSLEQNYQENYLQTGRGEMGDNQSDPVPQIIQPNHSGWVNTTCGYNPSQTRNGLPSNLPVGNCQQSPEMKRYNENLFTQTVTPGVYSINQVNEPINSNIGISFNQQFEPVTCKRTEKGLEYVLHDPRIIEPAESIDIPPQAILNKADYDNVYDPRFYGYGTSYRSYLEPVTGQTRFMYDDINAIKMPNYVTRSKIDHLPYADSYGPVQEGSEMGNRLNPDIRTLVQDSWLRDSVGFREDISQKLMRKVNAEGWQKRMYPNSSRPVGSGNAPGGKR